MAVGPWDLLRVAPLLLVGSGMSVLLRRHGAVATAIGAGLSILNPYVAERLLLGEAPTMLGFAMIPWLVAAVRSDRPLTWRVLLVLPATLPAALTPVGTVTAGLTVLVAALVVGPRTATARERWTLARRARDAAVLLAPVGLLSLPWILAALESPAAGAAPGGADAFAVRSDGYLAVGGSVATLGGVWSSSAWPDSRDNGFVTVLSLLLVLGAAAAWFVLRGAAEPAVDEPGTGASPRRRSLDLAALGYVGPVVTVLLLAGPLLPVWRVLQQVPGLALLRDTHRLLAWAALAVAALLALGVAAALDRLGSRPVVGAGAAVVVLLLGVLTVPDVPGRLAHWRYSEGTTSISVAGLSSR